MSMSRRGGRSRIVDRVAIAALVLLLLPGVGAAQVVGGADVRPTTFIYLVVHGEIDPRGEGAPLNERGRERAIELARALERIPLTHVFSSHTLRSRQTVAPAAEAHGLEVVALPVPGSSVDGQPAGDRSPSRLAIGPVADALSTLPPGSHALVGLNSDNLFAILNRLGVPAATEEDPCNAGEVCVPCLSNACFPREFDNLWILALSGDRPAELIQLRFGT
jgi:hypothetical protein